MYKIYKHTFQDGRSYIGFTGKDNPNNRWRCGWGYIQQREFFGEIMKYGWYNMTHEILEEVVTKAAAQEREQYYIEFYETYNPEKGFNIQGKDKLSTKKKRVVVCVETGDIYYTCKEAAEAMGCTTSAISQACCQNKPCKKFHWRYEEREIPVKLS